MLNPTAKKTLNIIKTVVVWLIFAFALGVMIFTIVSVTTFDKKDRGLFGIKAFIVLSDSMEATDFAAGDLIFSKKVDPSTLQEGDIITFQSVNPESFGEIVTHKIRSVTKDDNGELAFVTYGTTTDTNDAKLVTQSFVIGKYCGKLKGVGTFAQYLQTAPGYFICIFGPFMILMLILGVNTVRLFHRYKQEQASEIEAEKQSIEAERLESKRMLEELQALRAQLEQKSVEQKAEQPPEDKQD